MGNETFYGDGLIKSPKMSFERYRWFSALLITRQQIQTNDNLVPDILTFDLFYRAKFLNELISLRSSSSVSSPRSLARRCGLFPTRRCETPSVSLSKATSKMVGLKENIRHKHHFSSYWHCSFYHCNPYKTTHWWSFFVLVVIFPFVTSATIE